MSTQEQQPSEEELRAAYEAEIKKIRVEHVLLEQVVSLVNIGMRRTGQAPGTEDERDLGQVKLAIDSVRALMPMLEQSFPQQVPPIRDAVSQLQLAFVKLGGEQKEPAESAGVASEPPRSGEHSGGGGSSGDPRGAPPQQEPKPGDPGPAQRSGRLWIPGQ